MPKVGVREILSVIGSTNSPSPLPVDPLTVPPFKLENLDRPSENFAAAPFPKSDWPAAPPPENLQPPPSLEPERRKQALAAARRAYRQFLSQLPAASGLLPHEQAEAAKLWPDSDTSGSASDLLGRLQEGD